MIELFLPLQKYFKDRRICLDNKVFKLHYIVTHFVLIVFSGLIAAKQYIGEPIDCVASNEKLEKDDLKAINAYCWIHSTYTVGYGLDLQAHPGVGNGHREDINGPNRSLKYYQWVVFVLWIQACCFRIPRFLWENIFEGGKMEGLIKELNQPIGDPEKKAKRKPLLLDYIMNNLSYHKFYALQFFFCEFLNWVNILGQIFIMDKFFDDEFIAYGAKVLEFINLDPEDRGDPMSRLFPRMAKCTFKRFGPGGSIVNYDSLCILPINNINEKIIVIIWIWFMFLACITTLAILRRVLTLQSLTLRSHVLDRSFRTTSAQCYFLTRHLCFGDWFLLTQIGKNVETSVYADLLHDLEEKFSAMDGKGVDAKESSEPKDIPLNAPNNNTLHIDDVDNK